LAKRIVILTGAGTPIAWNAPTTKRLTDIICENDTFRSRTGQPIGDWFRDRLRTYYHKDKDSVNFETILYALETLSSYYSSVLRNANHEFRVQTPAFFDPKDDFNELLDFDRLYDSEHSSWVSHDHLHKTYNWWNDIDYFFENVYTTFVNILVYQIFTYENQILNTSNNKINDDLQDFFRFYDQGILRTYSLNYDRLFTHIGKIDFFEGFVKHADGKKIFDSNLVLKSRDVNCHYSIHGNIYFHTDLHSIELKSEPVYFNRSGNFSQKQNGEKILNSNIISGLDKASRLLQSPYSEFYHSLYEDCINADIIYTIGYSYSDKHVNSAIKIGMQTNIDQKHVCIDWHGLKPIDPNIFNPEWDLQPIKDHKVSAILGTNHKIWSIMNKEIIDRSFYSSNGFTRFLRNKTYEKL
jgi:hypothetical protein